MDPGIGVDGSKPPSPKNGRAEGIRKLYDLCRKRGMTDAVIGAKLAREGFAKLEDITDKALPNLLLWADRYKSTNAGQGCLL